MSVKYIPVQWNLTKWVYDSAMLVGVGLFLWVFINITPDVLNHDRAINPQIHNARAFGACTFVMLTVILCIGPLARLDARFLPLLYNRRHFGVMTSLVALTHAYFILNWYFAFSRTDKFVGAIAANTSYDRIVGFPFEALGIFALICLLILAATSHDFWLKFLTAPVWKRIHYMIYPAYVAVVGHITLGIFQDQNDIALFVIVIAGALAVTGLHLTAWWTERGRDPAGALAQGWVRIAQVADIAEGRAKIVRLPDGDRVAVFRHEGRLSAIANACAHQNGPLGEGRILDCLVTCPWHGFQYDVTTGRSPAPFTEKIPTYALRVENGEVWVNPAANPPGTYVEPVPVLPAQEVSA